MKKKKKLYKSRRTNALFEMGKEYNNKSLNVACGSESLCNNLDEIQIPTLNWRKVHYLRIIWRFTFPKFCIKYRIEWYLYKYNMLPSIS